MAKLEDVILRGDRASQPAATTVAIGTLYGVTDEDNIVERSNGTTWDDYSPAPAAGSVTPSTFEYRLSGTSGVAVTTTDVTAIATLYLTPYIGNKLSLYTASAWTSYSQGEKSVALTGLIKGATYDIFAYDDTGTVTLEAVAWKKVAASNSPAAGSNVSISLTDTATLAVGQLVGVRDGSASEIAKITVVVANTSITVATLANSYTTPDVYGYRARATALTTQDGVLVKTGATDRRYCGSITITSTTGQTEDSGERRLVFNYYNRVARKLYRVDTTNSWTYSTAAYRQANGSAANQVEVTTGVAEDTVRLTQRGIVLSSGAAQRLVLSGIGLNVTATNSAMLFGAYNVGNAAHIPCISEYCDVPGIGFNYLAWLEYGGGTDVQTWYGDTNANSVADFSGLLGMCWA